MSEHLKDQLRAADPLAHESGLSDAEVDAMRRAITAEASGVRRVEWRSRPAALVAATAAVAVTVAAGTFIRALFEAAHEPVVQPQAHEQRELQFETPGGTRVVWVLSSQFDLPEDRQQ